MEDFSLCTSTDLDILAANGLAPLFWRPARVGLTSAWWEHVPFGQWLVAAIKPRKLVELGTHNGVSYSAFCEAVVREHLDSQCSAIDTWQGDAQAGLYEESVYSEFKVFHDAHFGSFSTLIRSTFDDAIEYFADGSIDLLHIDGLHSYDAVRHDFEFWFPKLSDRAVVLFHDTNVRSSDFGVWRLWEELRSRFSGFAFVHGSGLGVLAVGDSVPGVIRELCSVSEPARLNAIRERFALIGERWSMEYRDSVRIAELGKHERTNAAFAAKVADLEAQLEHRRELALQLERALEDVKASHAERNGILAAKDADIASLRKQLADSELAKLAMHSAVEKEREHADMMVARVDELKMLSADLLASNEIIRAELVDLRRVPEKSELNEIRQDIVVQREEHQALRAQVSAFEEKLRGSGKRRG
jgi:O-antigen biosynthesis protein